MTRFLYGRELIVAGDRETAYVDRLRNAFRRRPGIFVERVDLESDAVLDLAHYDFDTVTCINVLEQTDDDVGALKRAHALLVAGGRMVIFAPAGASLFGTMDRAIGHQRRYERAISKKNSGRRDSRSSTSAFRIASHACLVDQFEVPRPPRVAERPVASLRLLRAAVSCARRRRASRSRTQHHCHRKETD